MTPIALKEHPCFGSFAAIAAVVGKSRQATHKWRRIPAEHCLALEAHAISHGYVDINRYTLRPDVFGAAAMTFKRAS